MATIQLSHDFKEFLRLLKLNHVEYLLIGGWAVSFYGYTRATADIDLRIAMNPANTESAAAALRQFGCKTATEDLFSGPEKIIRMAVPPLRIEILTAISGVRFDECYSRRIVSELGGVAVSVIDLDDLKTNKRASGRFKDLADLEELG